MKKRLTKAEKEKRLEAQRLSLGFIVGNILDAESGVSDAVKGAVCSSLMNMFEENNLEFYDKLQNLLNEKIDGYCFEMEEKTGVEDYKEFLWQQVKNAREIMETLKKVQKQKIERINRIMEGDEILSKINLN